MLPLVLWACDAPDVAVPRAPTQGLRDPRDVSGVPRPAPVGPVDFGRPLVASLRGSDVHFAPHADGALVAVGVRDVAAWSCERVGDDLSCGPGELRLSWPCAVESLTLSLADSDGDGLADGGEVRWAGVCGGWCTQASPVDEVAPLRPDAAGSASWFVEPVHFPWEPVRLLLREPADPLAPPTVMAGAVPVSLAPELGPGGVALAWESAPGALPWGVPVVLAAPPRDLAGNPMDAPPVSIPADPGPWASNAGFELAAGGWLARAVTLGPAAGFDGAEGAGFAQVFGGGTLAGVVEVPEARRELRFAWKIPDVGSPAAAVSILEASGARHVVWEAEPLLDTGSCAGPACPWQEAAFDLGPWAGTTVIVEFTNPRHPLVFCSEFDLPPPPFWVDDVRVE